MKPETTAHPGAFDWSDEFLLGFAPMDEVHKEFVEIVGKLITAPQGELRASLDELAAHLERHFEAEDNWMRETDFPPRECHIDEHAAVMLSVRQVQSLLARAQAATQDDSDATARSLALALQDWFPGHATHLDSALSHWMCKRKHGGKPIVLRRNLSLRSGT